MFKDYRLNQKPTYNFIEIIQHRVSTDGTKVVLARNKRPMSRWFYNPWDVNSPLPVKKPTYYTDNCYYVSPAVTLSLSVLPILKRNGFRGNTHGLTPTDCISNLMNSNKHETLFKARQYSAFKYFSVKTIENYWASLKIAMRNHYIIKDASTWKDLIDALQVCGIDTQNPKFVCPKNMKEAHDFWVKKAERIK